MDDSDRNHPDKNIRWWLVLSSATSAPKHTSWERPIPFPRFPAARNEEEREREREKKKEQAAIPHWREEELVDSI